MTQKQRSLLTLAGVVVVAGALGAGAWWTQKDEAQKKDAEEKTAKILPDYDKDKVVSVKLTAKGQTTELIKDGDLWNMVSPLKVLADSGTVEAMLVRLGNLKKKTTLEAKEADPKKLGFDKPSAEVVVGLQGGKSYDVIFGDENTFSASAYAKLAGSDAVYLTEGVNNALEKTPFDLRDKRVMPFEDKDLNQLAVTTPEGSYELRRSGASWLLGSSGAVKADEGMVNRILGNIRNLRATAIPEDHATNLAPYGLDAPQTELVLTLASGSPVTLSLATLGGKDKPSDKKTFAKRSDSGAVFQVAPNAQQDFVHKDDELLDKTVASFDKEAVAALAFTTPSGEKVLVQRKRGTLADGGKGEETWSELSPKAALAKRWKMSGLLYGLAGLKGTKIVEADAKDLAVYGLDKPTKKVELQDPQGKVLAEVWLGKDATPNSVYVKSASSDRVYEVDKVKFNDWPSSGDDLLDQPPPPPTNAAPTNAAATSSPKAPSKP